MHNVMLNTSDMVLEGQDVEGNKCIGTNRSHCDGSHGSHDQVSPSSDSLGKLTPCTPDDIPLLNRSSTVFIEDLLEDLLSCATSRSALRRSGRDHHLSESTGNHGNRISMHSSKEAVDDSCALTRKTYSLNISQCYGSSTSETDSSNSDSENTTTLLTSPLDEPDAETERDVLLRTKNERDESKIYIPRPDFVTTEEHTLVKVGTISAVLDDAIVVTTFNLTEPPRQLSDADISNATALDTGSLLCFSDGAILGAVFETFGPVSSPLYVIRFNNSDEIPSAARVGVEVKYVEQEMRLVRGRDVRGKGYDASGKDDEEANAEEFSDDEMERRAKKKKRSGTMDRRVGPQKRARGYSERHGHGRSERGERQKEGHHDQRERYQHHEVERRWATGSTEQPGYGNFIGYNPGPYPYYPSGISPQPVPHALVPDPRFPNGTLGNHMPGAATVSGFYASGAPLSMPSPLITPPGRPGPALSAIMPSSQFGRQLPPTVFPQAAAPYGASPTISLQPQFACPEENLAPQVNFHLTRHNGHSSSTYRQYNLMQTQTGQVPRMGPSQHRPFPNPNVWNRERK